ncbi:hypothetical protein [Prochlorococcus sp. MIT 1341]|uniref:hypothetical protein n=1 Tax=Prochlorococcus sp. MIT 1341 TaxID=3096221 RepID=UPI002A757E98|nr:hypothetical protein [Prochlorococcus sp. MIT 1341]
MSLDSHSLQKLRELGRQLPKPLPKPDEVKKSTNKKNQYKHPVETEKNPEKLFKELIKISPDGSIPSHLINRLKEVESDYSNHNQDNKHLQKITSDNSQKVRRINFISNKNSLSKSNINSQQKKDEEKLYVNFKQLLLEED